MKKPFLIITDSSTTLNKQWANENDVKILPLSILRSDETLMVDDWVQTTPEKIFKQWDEGYTFKTSSTPLGVMLNEFEEGFKEYEKIIFIGISAGYSSQFNNANFLAKQFEDKLITYDTQTFGYGLESLVYKLKDFLKTNPNNQQIYNLIDEHHKRVSSFLVCEDIRGLIASGRIPKLVGSLLKLSKITPIIKAEFKNHHGGTALNIKQAPNKMMKLVHEVYNHDLKPNEIETVCILEAGLSDAKINELKQEVIRYYNISEDKIVVRSGPPIFLVYVLKNSFGFQFITKKQKTNFEEKH